MQRGDGHRRVLMYPCPCRTEFLNHGIVIVTADKNMRGLTIVRAGMGKGERAVAHDGAGIGDGIGRYGFYKKIQCAAFCAALDDIVAEDGQTINFIDLKVLQWRSSGHPVVPG